MPGALAASPGSTGSRQPAPVPLLDKQTGLPSPTLRLGVPWVGEVIPEGVQPGGGEVIPEGVQLGKGEVIS